MVHFSRSIGTVKTFYNCEAKDLGVVWCSYNERTKLFNEWTNFLLVYRCLLANRLLVKQLNYAWLTAGITE